MSRIGNSPIAVPAGVEVSISGQGVSVKGRHGSLSLALPGGVEAGHDSASRVVKVQRTREDRDCKSLHGLMRSLIANMVRGVHEPWEKRLEIVGVGFQAAISQDKLTLNVGFANPVVIMIPKTVRCVLPDNTHIVLTSADRQLVGQVAANIRAVRPPEPYKGKGIRYQGEQVKIKPGKTAS